MIKTAGCCNQGVRREIIAAKITEQFVTRDAVQGSWGSRNCATQRLIRPKGAIQKFLNMMMRLIEVHRDLFLDHVPFFIDIRSSEFRSEEHVHQDFDEYFKSIVTCARMKTGRFLAGESVQIAANTLHRF